ncbi:pyridoxamine 5'-phosphate oxidase family protein [Streptomyces sp. NBC_00487]|uniref:pyridoxamine 5'-phosphate oxidase family protein n=1 Tax=unclassified Streptomyces TaxID=2593676 RepID=UPI002E177D9D|nr:MULTISPECIES: pyridoxamine 5'-phosphate oxidase family protein [unclassified Streptomyces]
MNPHDGFRELDRQWCLCLLARASVGRVVHTRHALPAVLPVHFSLDANSAVVLRTAADSELCRAIDGAVVAFEADEVIAAPPSGWSVVVTGRATVVTDPAEHTRLSRTGPRCWGTSSEEEDVFIRIEPELVTGRELVGGHTIRGVNIAS